MRRTSLLVLVLSACVLPALPAGATPTRARTGAIDDPVLLAAVARAERGVTTSSEVPAREPSVGVEVLHHGADAIVDALVAAVGGAVTGHAPGTIVQATVPVAALPKLAGDPAVTYVRATRSVVTRPTAAHYLDAGPLTIEATAVTNAAAWQTAGQTGGGVKVGIIDYFNGTKWNTQVASGEVPVAAGTFCLDSIADGVADCPGGSVFDPTEEGHGNAVAEIIHDLAPSAQLFLGRGSSISDSYRLMDWFAANGVRIVNRSLGSPYDGPGDGTGELDDLADYAVAQGITLINSAGNEGSNQYWRGTWSDTDGDNWLEFGSGDEAMNVDTSLSSGCLDVLGLRWSDWGDPAARTNYDVFLYDGNTRVYPSQGPNQQAGAPPIELDGISTCGYADPNIRVYRTSAGSGSNGDVIELLTYAGDLERSQSAFSAGTGIVDSRNRAVVAVGAIDPVDSGALAPYSSQGPTNDGRRKPDLSAASALTTSIFGSRAFRGTSASAPVATGVAALLLGSNRAASAQGLAALLKHDVIDRGVPGPDSSYGTGELRLPAPTTGAVDARPAVFTAMTPQRILDTRSAAPNGDPTLAGPLEPERIVDLPVAGVSVPAGATAVVLNVTVVHAGLASYAQVFPTGFGSVDASSNLNLESSGQVLPNFVIVPIGQDGRISVYLPAGGDLLVDLLGSFSPSDATAAGRFQSLIPTRVLDTRKAGGKPKANSSTTVSFPASTGLPSGGVAAVVVTVTGTEVPVDGYVTAYPTGGAVPPTSTLNLVKNDTNANTAIVPLGSGRSISLYSQSGTHLIVDLQGYVTDGSAGPGTAGRFVPVNPGRVLDTRTGSPVAAAATTALSLAGQGGLPANGFAAVSFNFTAVTPQGPNGYLQVWPSDVTPTGEFSNLNWSRAGQTIASAGIVTTGSVATVDLRSSQTTHLAVDVNGYFTAA